MTRIFIDGLESGGLDQFTTQSGCTVVSTSGLSMDGDYCLEATGASDYVLKTVTETDDIYAAFLYRPTTVGSVCPISFWSGSTLIASLRSSTAGAISINVGSSALASSSFAWTAGTTYLVEVYYLIADSGGRFTVKIKGITLIDYTGDTLYSTYTTLSGVRFGYAAVSTATQGNAYFDNIILDDAAWIGSTKIQGIALSGAGTTAQWTPSAGANYVCVDEVPASDADYVYTNTNDHLDTYAVADLSGTIGTIKAVQVQARVVKEGSATPQNIKMVLKSGSTTDLSADIAVPTTAATVAAIWEADPDTSAAWITAGVNASEIGIKSAA